APAAPSCGRSTSLASVGLDGFERCENGVVHRAARRTCPSKLPRADVAFPPGPSQNCTRDADCTRSPNGHCALGGLAGPDGMRHTICLYGCMTDADCPAQSICVCADPVGACALAYCGTDADCPAPYLCAESQAGCAATFACQTPEDTCALDADCAADCDGSPCREAGRSCELVAGHLSCQFSACPPSRP
ncbi:MAG: hypothetical protein JOZ69_24845, partial [Myxococcales bacterium]|nr:hypothetical protein [Myxococcales bacterium]